MEGLFKWEIIGDATENPAWDMDTTILTQINLDVRREINPSTPSTALQVDDFTRDALEDCIAG